jgi:hypothetical protein
VWLIEAGVLLNMLGYRGVLPSRSSTWWSPPRREPVRGGYRQVLRDRAFLHLAVADVAMIAVGWGVFSWLLPPFARNQAGLSTSVIGLAEGPGKAEG